MRSNRAGVDKSGACCAANQESLPSRAPQRFGQKLLEFLNKASGRETIGGGVERPLPTLLAEAEATAHLDVDVVHFGLNVGHENCIRIEDFIQRRRTYWGLLTDDCVS